MKSNYLYPCVRQSLIKRIIRWLYFKYVNEPYFPKGFIEFTVKEKGYQINCTENTLQINYRPERFVQGMLEDYFFDGYDCKVNIIKLYEKKLEQKR